MTLASEPGGPVVDRSGAETDRHLAEFLGFPFGDITWTREAAEAPDAGRDASLEAGS